MSKVNLTINMVTTISVPTRARSIATTPDGTKAYVTNFLNNFVSVIDRTSNMVSTIPVASIAHLGVAVSPGGTEVYVGWRWQQ